MWCLFLSVYSGEVDAVDPTSKADNKYVEFKTSREIDTPRQDENFKKYAFTIIFIIFTNNIRVWKK